MSENSNDSLRSPSNSNENSNLVENSLSDGLMNLSITRAPESSENCASDQIPLLEINNAVRLVMERTIPTENWDDHSIGGYCNVNIGAVYNNKYEIIKKLGWAVYSVVYMARNRKNNTYVALKFTKSAEDYFDFSVNEITFHDVMKEPHLGVVGANHVTTLLDSFILKGKNGSHVVMVFELLGPTSFDVIFSSNIDMFHTEKARQLCRQLLQAVIFLHDECGIIHCSIKTNNILIKICDEDIQALDRQSPTYDPYVTSYAFDFANPDSDIQIKLGDFRTSVYMANNRNHQIQTCTFRAPEMFLGCRFDPSSDLWSVGCVLYTLITGQSLFHCKRGAERTVDGAYHLSQMQELLGPITRQTFQSSRNRQQLDEFFGPDEMLKTGTEYNPQLLMNTLVSEQCMLRGHIDQFVDFLTSLLKLDPQQRPTAKEALDHEFLLPFGGNAPPTSH